jgi:hypothetical protein
VTSTKGAELAPWLDGKKNESPSCAESDLTVAGAEAELALTAGVMAWELVVAPTLITDGALDGDEMELKYG